MVPIERLGAMMENLSARMNQNRLATAGVGGLDHHGPVRMHSHIPEDTPERLRQKQDLKDGGYSGRKAKSEPEQKPIYQESKDPITPSSNKFENIEEKIDSKDNINNNDSLELKKGKRLELSDFTKEIMETKPMNSPVPKKWYAKGGYISIDEHGTWTYTNKEGVWVSYPNGYPDFSRYYHPTIQPVTIDVTIPKNPQADFKKANLKAGLNKILIHQYLN